MGIRDFFRGSGKSRTETKIDKLIKSTTTQYGASPDRYAAMQQLFDMAQKNPEHAEQAYVGLLKRFTIQSSKSIEDEEEKGWVYRELAAIGKPLLPAIETYCKEQEKIAWALRLLEDTANEEEEWKVLDALLDLHPAGSIERTPDKKIDILTHVQEIDDPRVIQRLCSYLEDRDEKVRFFVVEALVDIAEESALPALVARLASPEEDSIRIKTRILDGIAALDWSIQAHRETIAPHLGHEHQFENDRIKRR